MALVKCKKCDGKGNVGSYSQGLHGEFTYTVDNGNCWECNGKGKIDTLAQATKDDMQKVFSTVYYAEKRNEKPSLNRIKSLEKTLTRVVIKDAVEKMIKMGLLKKEGRYIMTTQFGRERWEARLERVKKEYPLELL